MADFRSNPGARTPKRSSAVIRPASSDLRIEKLVAHFGFLIDSVACVVYISKL
jgi:hypothetical protein